MFWGAHKNRLIETILVSTQNDVLAEKYEKTILSMHSYQEV